MKTIALVPGLFLCAALAAASAADDKAGPPPAAPNPAFAKLQGLAGDWTGTAGGKPVKVSYRVVSNGSAVMETIDSEGHSSEMITMYHPDGASLLMTHYCSIGNQPRMRAKGLEAGKLDFRYVDASNLASPDAPRMSRLVMSFPDADHLVAEWTYRDGAKEQTERFEVARKK